MAASDQVAIVGATDFDPEGNDNAENGATAGQAVDGNNGDGLVDRGLQQP